MGSGAAHAWLKVGANVFVVSRTQDKLSELIKQFKDFPKVKGLVGGFESEKAVNLLKDQLVKHLNGAPLHHVVSSLGFVKSVKGGIADASVDEVKSVLDDGFYPNFLAAKAFLPLQAQVEGSSFTIISGGLAYMCPAPHFWSATIKNTVLNGLTLSLGAQFPNVAVNAAVIFFGVARHGETKNQWGMDSADTYDLGEFFVAVPEAGKKSQLIDLKSIDDVKAFAAAIKK